MVFTAAAVVWALSLPLAALGRARAPRQSPAWVGSTAVYVAGAVVCHQRPERSFRLAGQPMAVCARCLGMYAGAAATALLLMAFASAPSAGRQPRAESNAAVRWTALFAALPTAATLMWEWTAASTPSNVVRAVAGVPLGVFVAWVIGRAGQRYAQSE